MKALKMPVYRLDNDYASHIRVGRRFKSRSWIRIYNKWHFGELVLQLYDLLSKIYNVKVLKRIAVFFLFVTPYEIVIQIVQNYRYFSSDMNVNIAALFMFPAANFMLLIFYAQGVVGLRLAKSEYALHRIFGIIWLCISVFGLLPAAFINLYCIYFMLLRGLDYFVAG